MIKHPAYYEMLAKKQAAERAQREDATRCNNENTAWLGSSPLHCALEKDHDGLHRNGHRTADGTYSFGVLYWS